MNYVERAARAALCVDALMSMAARATVTRGSNDAWVVNTDPSGEGRDHQRPSVPGDAAIKMSRKSEFTATITKPGYKTATVQVSHKTANAGAAGVAGNVLLGGVIGRGVDMYGGASQDLTPNPVTLKLEPAVAGEASKPAAADEAKPAG